MYVRTYVCRYVCMYVCMYVYIYINVRLILTYESLGTRLNGTSHASLSSIEFE